MENTKIISEFDRLWCNAKEQYDRSVDASDYESSFEKVLFYILAHQSYERILEEELIRFYKNPARSIPELLEFCMATLHWSKVREVVANDLLGEVDVRHRACASNILSAYTTHWPGYKIYRHYDKS